MTLPRYALYFTPSADSQFWQTGSAWIGRDAASNAPITRPLLSSVADDALVAITQHPRRYGFHATLKAPFHLAENSNVDLLLQHVAEFAKTRTSFMLPRLSVAMVRIFWHLFQPNIRAKSILSRARALLNLTDIDSRSPMQNCPSGVRKSYQRTKTKCCFAGVTRMFLTATVFTSR